MTGGEGQSDVWVVGCNGGAGHVEIPAASAGMTEWWRCGYGGVGVARVRVGVAAGGGAGMR